MTIQRITSDFADRVGGDGFYDIKRAKNWGCKFVWIVICLVTWSLVLFQVYTHITTFLKYEVKTVVTLEFDEAADFPAVSFCNLNPVKWSRVSGDESSMSWDLQNLLKPELLEEDLKYFEKTDWDTQLNPPPVAADNSGSVLAEAAPPPGNVVVGDTTPAAPIGNGGNLAAAPPASGEGNVGPAAPPMAPTAVAAQGTSGADNNALPPVGVGGMTAPSGVAAPGPSGADNNALPPVGVGGMTTPSGVAAPGPSGADTNAPPPVGVAVGGMTAQPMVPAGAAAPGPAGAEANAPPPVSGGGMTALPMQGMRRKRQAENNVDSSSDGDYDYSDYDWEHWEPDDHPEEIQVKSMFYNWYFKESDEDKLWMGHQMNDMLVECVWQEKQCYPWNFTHYLHPKYGNCFTFNAGWSSENKKNTTIHKAHLPGPSDGLSVTLFVESVAYMPLIADSTGVRVHVHSQRAFPHPEDTGFTVSAGFASALELKKVEIKRLPLPYESTDCKNWFNYYEEDIRWFWPRANYSMVTCMKLCYQYMLLKECHCADSTNYFLNHTSYGWTPQPCNITNSAQGSCLNKFSKRFRSGSVSAQCQSRCPQSCYEETFEVQYSSSVWPNHYYEDILVKTMDSRNSYIQTYSSEDPNADGHDNYIKDNMLKVDVYYQSLNYKMIQEEANYVLVDMLADLGGAVDLWVGMSVLAMVQVIEYIIEILVYVGCPTNETGKKTAKNKVHHAGSASNFPEKPTDEMYSHYPSDFDYKPTVTTD